MKTQNDLNSSFLGNFTSDPVSGIIGDTYFNTATNEFKYFDGTNWVVVPFPSAVSFPSPAQCSAAPKTTTPLAVWGSDGIDCIAKFTQESLTSVGGVTNITTIPTTYQGDNIFVNGVHHTWNGTTYVVTPSGDRPISEMQQAGLIAPTPTIPSGCLGDWVRLTLPAFGILPATEQWYYRDSVNNKLTLFASDKATVIQEYIWDCANKKFTFNPPVS